MADLSQKLNEVIDRLDGRTVGIYDDVCRKHDIDWLIAQAEKVEQCEEVMWYCVEDLEGNAIPKVDSAVRRMKKALKLFESTNK